MLIHSRIEEGAYEDGEQPGPEGETREDVKNKGQNCPSGGRNIWTCDF